MKANQKFVTADEAVSPVIGVILMVAITVVLAAVVFVLVSDLGDSGESAPQMSFDSSDSLDRIQVIKAPSGLSWDAFDIKIAAALTGTDKLCFGVNKDAALSGAGCASDIVSNVDGNEAGELTTTGQDVSQDTTTPLAVTGGDFIDLCGMDGVSAGKALSGVTVTIVHSATNSITYTREMPSIQAC